MARNVTFGKKVGLGFVATVVLTIAIALVAIHALHSVVASKDRVIEVNAKLLLEAQRLDSATERKSAAVRGFLLTREDKFLEQFRRARDEFADLLNQLKDSAYSEEGRRALEPIASAEAEYDAAVDQVFTLRKGAATVETIARVFEEQVTPKREALTERVASFLEREDRRLDEAKRTSTNDAALAIKLVATMAASALLLASVLALLLTRALSQQIGTTVGQVQSSSAELQAAANQQATGAKEQATAMSEISTTISELMATSLQIAESAQRVAHIADEAAASSRGGEGAVGKAHESIAGIRRQVDLVVNHMLDLGRKSQQIGAVVDMVTELAEQTNILAVNATIEAAGAGESGKRFAVVADEIRKLADRVAGSAKEIRGLVDDVRGAVNTTVMATESGSKSVDAGSRQFGEVATVFKQISALLATTNEAAREIELSTKQQATAVEQVNVAIANVAQASRETEASSSQTLQTASQLSRLSRDLLRLVRTEAAA